jgi:uncharacterized protein (TIGR02186 family)
MRGAALTRLGAGLVLLQLAGLVPEARAEELVTALSSNRVSIESNFTGAEIVLFGTIERDAQTVGRRLGYDIVVIARGPEQEIITRKKDRIAGIWMNSDSRRFLNAPSYLAVLSNQPLEKIAPLAALEEFQIGLDKLVLLQPGHYTPEDAQSEFKRALLRLMRQKELYLENAAGVTMLSRSLFLARIPLPAHVPVGTFRAEVLLFADGALLERSDVEIFIRKGGFESFISQSAVQYPLIYGLAAVLLAFFSGWAANLIFRKD